MTIQEIIKRVPTLRKSEKLQLLQVLAHELAKEQQELFESDGDYPVWSPHDSYDAADQLSVFLQNEASNS